MENLQGVAGFPVVDAAALFEMEEEKEKSKFDQQSEWWSRSRKKWREVKRTLFGLCSERRKFAMGKVFQFIGTLQNIIIKERLKQLKVLTNLSY